VQYIHDYIQQKHGITVPIKTTTPLQIANVKYLLCAVDKVNLALGTTTNYCNHALATQQVVDTVATIDAIDRLVKDTLCRRVGYYMHGAVNTAYSCDICPKNHYCPGGDFQAISCNDGYGTTGTGSTSSTQCTRNSHIAYVRINLDGRCTLQDLRLNINPAISFSPYSWQARVDWGDGKFNNATNVSEIHHTYTSQEVGTNYWLAVSIEIYTDCVSGTQGAFQILQGVSVGCYGGTTVSVTMPSSFIYGNFCM
jgi:hypothetical protein